MTFSLKSGRTFQRLKDLRENFTPAVSWLIISTALLVMMVKTIWTICKLYASKKNLKLRMLKSGRFIISQTRTSPLEPWLPSAHSMREKLLSWEVASQMQSSYSIQSESKWRRLQRAAPSQNTWIFKTQLSKSWLTRSLLLLSIGKINLAWLSTIRTIVRSPFFACTVETTKFQTRTTLKWLRWTELMKATAIKVNVDRSNDNHTFYLPVLMS